MKYIIFGTILSLSLCLSGCATPHQIKESSALHEVHKSERKVAVDKVQVVTTTLLLQHQKEKLSSDKDALSKDKATFETLYNSGTEGS